VSNLRFAFGLTHFLQGIQGLQNRISTYDAATSSSSSWRGSASTFTPK